jgi:protein-S-isoprenylcysteine O-methyltransferase Ste14
MDKGWKMYDGDHMRLTFWGASPIIFALTIIYAILIFIIDHLYGSIFEIDFIPNRVSIALSIALLCIGIPLYIMVLKGLRAAYRRYELMTTGCFSICRNPLFAVVIFLVLPGLLLLFDSWILLTIPFFMYIMFKVFISREEHLMEKEFGQDYITYKNNTSQLFPKLWNYKK